MKYLVTAIAILGLAFSINSCSQNSNAYSSSLWGGKKVVGSKNYVKKNIKVDNFEGISVAGSPDVTYTQKSGNPSVEVYTSDNIIDLLDIRVKDNMLYIGFKKNTSVSYNKLEIKITSGNLSNISVAGSGSIRLANGLKTTNGLTVNIAGSGSAYGENLKCSSFAAYIAGSGGINAKNIACDKLKTSIAGSGDLSLQGIKTIDTECSISGSGTAILTGSAQNATYSISGSGDLKASDCEVSNISASISGSGDIKCYATESLKARSSGSGKIGYKGNPKVDSPSKSLYRL